MDIGDHRSDVAGAVWGLWWTGIFNRLEVCVDGWIKVHRVSLVERVDFAAWWNLNVWMGKDEFAQCGVERVTIYTLARGQNQVCRRSVPGGKEIIRTSLFWFKVGITKDSHDVARSSHLAPWP